MTKKSRGLIGGLANLVKKTFLYLILAVIIGFAILYGFIAAVVALVS